MIKAKDERAQNRDPEALYSPHVFGVSLQHLGLEAVHFFEVFEREALQADQHHDAPAFVHQPEKLFILANADVGLGHVADLQGNQSLEKLFGEARSEEHTSELQSQSNLVC